VISGTLAGETPFGLSTGSSAAKTPLPESQDVAPITAEVVSRPHVAPLSGTGLPFTTAEADMRFLPLDR